MTPKYTPIPRRYWRRDDGLQASLYSSCPWYSDVDKARWELVTDGWTIKHLDGTVGSRHSWKTREDVEAWIEERTAASAKAKANWDDLVYRASLHK